MPNAIVHNGTGLAWLRSRVLSLGRVHMANSKQLSSGIVAAEPEPIASRLVRNRARHHRHAARFHGARRLRRNARQRRLAACPRREADRIGAECRARSRHARRAHPRGPFARSVRCAAGQDRARRAKPSHRRSRSDGTDPDPRRSRPRHHSRRCIRSTARSSSTSPGRAHSTRPNSATSCRNTA